MEITRTKYWALAALPLVLFGALAGSVNALEPESAGDDADKEPTLEEYVRVDVSAIPKANTITTKLATDLQLTPAIVGTVSSELFREQQAVTLSDVLKNISGLNIQSQTGVHDFFVLRGFDSLSGGLVMIDGAPVPEATFYPTYNIEGVEVLKGPSGFLYGGDPLAGAVNVVRKQPVANDFVNVELGGGSFGTYQGNVDWNETNESNSLALRLNGFYRESEGYRDNKASDHWGINPSFTARIGESGSLNVNVESLEASYSPDAGLPLFQTIPTASPMIPNVDRETSYQSILDFSDQSIRRVQVDYEHEISDRVTLRNKTYFRDLDWQSAGTLLSQDFVVGGFVPTVARTLNTLDNQQQYYGNQFEVAFRIGEGRIKHNLLAGVEVARRDNDYDIDFGLLTSLELANPIDPDTSTSCPFSASPLCQFQNGSSESTILAPYVVDQIEFSPRCHVMLGVRYDDIDFDGTTTVYQGPFPTTQNDDRSDGDVSPRAGFLWAPDETLSFYANAAQSFAPPSARVVGPREPEESDQIEVGVKKKFLGGKVQTTFALFDMNRKNIAIPDNGGFTQQQGDQQSRGFEVELAAEPAPGLRTFFSYAYTDAELVRFAEQEIVGFDPMTMQPILQTFDRSGNVPAFAPENLVNLWISKQLGSRWGVGGGVRHIGDQFIAEDNGFEIGSATVLDATVFYRQDGWRFNLHLKNLTDEEYELRGFGSDSVIPADPFAVFATVGFEL